MAETARERGGSGGNIVEREREREREEEEEEEEEEEGEIGYRVREAVRRERVAELKKKKKT